MSRNNKLKYDIRVYFSYFNIYYNFKINEMPPCTVSRTKECNFTKILLLIFEIITGQSIPQ